MVKELEAQIIGAVANVEHGWCWNEKALAMGGVIVETKPETVVEIGVFGGRSFIPMVMALRDNQFGHAYGIDPWRHADCEEGDTNEANKEWWSNVDLHDIHRYCVEKIWKYELQDWCALIRATSQACVVLFDVIDVLHLDGNHSELASVRDVTLYLPKLKVGGFLFFDDVGHFETQKAVELVDAACDLIQSMSTEDGRSCALYRKHS